MPQINKYIDRPVSELYRRNMDRDPAKVIVIRREEGYYIFLLENESWPTRHMSYNWPVKHMFGFKSAK